MNTRARITMFLKEWLELTRGECHAIQMGRWSELSRIQKSKTSLQQPLTDAIEQWRLQHPEEAAASPIRGEICRLLDLESRHSELLAVRKREVREKILLIEQTLYDLRSFDSCLAPTRAWRSFPRIIRSPDGISAFDIFTTGIYAPGNL